MMEKQNRVSRSRHCNTRISQGDHSMAKERKMICTCGGVMELTTLHWFGFAIPGRKCDKCGEETVSATQSKLIDRRLRLQQVLRRPRKVIQIGNAMGITLPEDLKEIGIKIGKRVRAELIDDHSFKVVVE
jgi:ArsR family metal-binding transcriptional regulator